MGQLAPGLVKSFLVISYETVMTVLFSLPRYRTLNALKASFLKLCGARVGKRVVFYPGVWIAPGRNLDIGNDVTLAGGVIIGSAGIVKIGDRSLIGFRTTIISSNHAVPPNRGQIFASGFVRQPVVIGQDVWVGANVTILPGRMIGDGAVVAAGSVVTKNIEPFTIVGGNPAKVIRERT
ncbi:MAG: acyltransferase [Nitrospira sp.]|nr:acyltransferase [Nitrospira sp.]MDH4242729.1 acyltransferase [Nitrospira sp.]MDH4354938.1 acyltransferase [Nitrospira sp.]MDH5317251.1 acyltransferase [Nitrospira sp.]